jgi:hypothetical protein
MRVRFLSEEFGIDDSPVCGLVLEQHNPMPVYKDPKVYVAQPLAGVVGKAYVTATSIATECKTQTRVLESRRQPQHKGMVPYAAGAAEFPSIVFVVQV